MPHTARRLPQTTWGDLEAIFDSLASTGQYSAVLGHEAVAALTRTIDALGEARGRTMSAHAAFEKASPQLGVRPATLHGTGVEKPPTGASEAEGPILRAVLSAA